ncbi:hypothetical protein V3C99_005287, partial [Haemonchus contortus]
SRWKLWRTHSCNYLLIAMKKQTMKMFRQLLMVCSLMPDDEDSEGESDAGWSSTIVQPNVVPFTEDSGIQNDDVYAFSNPMSFYKLFMTDDLLKLVIEESNRYGSAKYSTWSVLEE